MPADDTPADPEAAVSGFFEIMRRRRSVRAFSERPVSRETVECLVRTAGSAPSGANAQPWRFVCVGDAATKARIRAKAEECERSFYAERASDSFLEALAPLETVPEKAFLETAPWLIAVFQLTATDRGEAVYHGAKSVGIAVGLLLAAAQYAGLATLVYTPSPISFLGPLLERPPHERPYCLIPLGYADPSYRSPAAVKRKPVEEIFVVR